VLTALVFLHNLVRWLVLVGGAAAVGTAASGARAGGPPSAAEARAGLVFTIALDVQVLLGFVIYGLGGSMARNAMAAGGAAMKDGALRFWLVEHPFMMLAALALAHVGRVRVKRAADDASKHRRALVFFGLALLAVVLGMPWPFLAHGRPLLPHF
jgi:hypothetical protein